MKALVAEGDFINRRVMQLFLASYGKCDVADNGRSALSMVEDAHRNNKPYALICMDSSLPELNGMELLRQIREFERQHALVGRDGARIMFLSVEAGKETILEAFRSQCDGFMLKPFRKRELVEFLHHQGLARVLNES